MARGGSIGIAGLLSLGRLFGMNCYKSVLIIYILTLYPGFHLTSLQVENWELGRPR